MMVSLECFSEIHLEETFLWINTPDVAVPFGFERRVTPEAHRQWFSHLCEDVTQAVFAIVVEGYGHVGNAGIKSINRSHRQGEIWIYIGNPELHGQHIGTSALRLLMEEAFWRMGLRRLVLRVFPDNLSAMRLYERAGFRKEGELRESVETASGNRTMLCMACLRSDFSSFAKPAVALMQPTFLSWLGYFELLEMVDTFVFLDDFQVSRQGWSQRNKLFLSPGRVGLVCLPLSHAQHGSSFVECKPLVDGHWKKKVLSSIRMTYANAPNTKFVLSLLENWLAKDHQNLADMLIDFTCEVAMYLGIVSGSGKGKTLLRSSQIDYDRTLHRSHKVKDLLSSLGTGRYYSPQGSFPYMCEDGVFPLESCPAFFQHHIPISYAQTGSMSFVPYLSVVDALCNLSPSEIRRVIRGTYRWWSWEDMHNQFKTCSAPPTDGGE